MMNELKLRIHLVLNMNISISRTAGWTSGKDTRLQLPAEPVGQVGVYMYA